MKRGRARQATSACARLCGRFRGGSWAPDPQGLQEARREFPEPLDLERETRQTRTAPRDAGREIYNRPGGATTKSSAVLTKAADPDGPLGPTVLHAWRCCMSVEQDNVDRGQAWQPLSTELASMRLGVTRSELLRLRSKGEIESRRVGRSDLWPMASLDAYVARVKKADAAARRRAARIR